MLIKLSFHVTVTFKWPCYTRSGYRHYGGNHQALNFINGTLHFIWLWENPFDFSQPVLVVTTAPAFRPSHRRFSLGDSFLRDAPQNILDCVGESGETYDDKQISKRSTQESMVSVDLLEVRRLGRAGGQVPIDGQVPVLSMVGFAIRHHVREGQHLWAGP